MKRYTKKPWSHEERIILSQNYYIVDAETLTELLPERSRGACVKQAKYLRDRGWKFKKP